MGKVKLTRQDITKKLLEDVANEFNREDVMNFETPIPTGRKVTKEALQKDVIEASGELQSGDIPKLAPKTIEVLEALEVKMPVEEGEEGDQTSPETNPDAGKAEKIAEKGPKTLQDESEGESKGQGEGGEGGQGEAGEIEKKARYTRSHALVDAFKKEGTKQDLIKRANDLYIKNGGADKIQVAKALLGYVLPSLLLLNVIEKADQTYRLVK